MTRPEGLERYGTNRGYRCGSTRAGGFLHRRDVEISAFRREDRLRSAPPHYYYYCEASYRVGHTVSWCSFVTGASPLYTNFWMRFPS